MNSDWRCRLRGDPANWLLDVEDNPSIYFWLWCFQSRRFFRGGAARPHAALLQPPRRSASCASHRADCRRCCAGEYFCAVGAGRGVTRTPSSPSRGLGCVWSASGTGHARAWRLLNLSPFLLVSLTYFLSHENLRVAFAGRIFFTSAIVNVRSPSNESYHAAPSICPARIHGQNAKR